MNDEKVIKILQQYKAYFGAGVSGQPIELGKLKLAAKLTDDELNQIKTRLDSGLAEELRVNGWGYPQDVC